MERRDYTLNGKLYQMLLPPVAEVMPIVCRTGVLIGSLAGELTSLRGSLDPELSAGDKIDVVLKTLGPIVGKINPTELNNLLMDAVRISNLCCDKAQISSAIDFERHFSINRSETLNVLLWCLWESVQDFFPQLGGIAQAAKKAMSDK